MFRLFFFKPCPRCDIKWLDYFYDANGSLFGFNYNGANYYYIRNGQNDIIGILDSTGTQVVSYQYDTWGKLLGISGSQASGVGTLNPFRYRGYYYDTETGLYSLQSRYYDPNTGRYLNADSVTSVGGDLLAANVFAYCHNNPVNMDDPSGHWPKWNKLFTATNLILTGVIVLSVAATILTCGTAAPLAAAIIGWSVAAVGAACITYGVADAIESCTGSNYIKDGVYGGNENAYNTTETGLQVVAAATTIGAGIADTAVGVCFVAGTSVLTATRKVAIEDIKVGDSVYSEDPKTGQVALKKVVKTFVHESNELVHIKVDGNTITSTSEHPYWVVNKGWTAAKNLRAGNKLLLESGKVAIIEFVQNEIIEKPVKVYNFEVEDFHTYFVGPGVLVHNTCSGNSLLTIKPAQGYALVDRDSGAILKYGETTLGQSRYTKNFLDANNADMRFLTSGSKYDMHFWQHDQIVNYINIFGERPSLNKSLW